MRNNIEVETTLAVVSESPEDTVVMVAGLTSVGPYELRHKADIGINDLYLDLPGNVLRSAGFGLRIRDLDGDLLVTLKGKPQVLPGGGIRRDELELPWSLEALSVLTARLLEHEIALPSSDPHSDSLDPLSVLTAIGFRVEQRRSTIRRPRDMMPSSAPATTVAELVVDSVEYHFENGDIRHHEIEIEQKGDGTVEDVQAATSSLLSLWPESLREWHFGKRSTGRVAEALIVERGLSGVVSASGNLLPEAYDLIRKRLS